MPGNSGALFSAYLQEKLADQEAIEPTGSPPGVRQWVAWKAGSGGVWALGQMWSGGSA